MAKGRRHVPPVTPRRSDSDDPVLPVPRPPQAGRFPLGPIPGHEPPRPRGCGTRTLERPPKRANETRTSGTRADDSGGTEACERALTRARAEHPAGARRPQGLRPWYTARPGDTLNMIAGRIGTEPEALARSNGWTSPAPLSAGQRVHLPLPTPPSCRPYTVGTHQTLASIAATTGTDLERILEVNGLPAGARRIRPGLRILLPVGPAGASKAGPPLAVVVAAAANRAALARRDRVPASTARQEAVRIAQRFGVDVPLALAVAYEESRFDQNRVSATNAIGVMQVVPSCGVWAGRVLAADLDLLEVTDNITTGVLLLAVLLHSHDEAGALAGYYQGAASVRADGPLPDTLQYVARVLRLRARFTGES